MSTYEPQIIRQQCLEEHQQLLEQAIATLTAKGCVVHQAKDAAQAAAIMAQLCPAEQKAMCTFAPELEELPLQQAAPQAVQTDLEALVAQKLERPYRNPRRAPLDDVTPEQITEILQQYLGSIESLEPASLMAAISKKIKADADQCDWGITGADAIAADTGTLILAEDQGNGRIVSNIPTRHMAVVGLEKIYPSNETVLETVHAAWTAGGRQSTPVYYSYITGPSRTGDIEGSMVCGMHGPQQVHVILLDNGRSTLFAQNKGQVLKCIECGRCTAALEQLTAGLHTPAPLTCKSLALANLQKPIQISDDQWQQLDFQCPVGITGSDLKQAMQ
ncbi:MAG: LUD domain-containing protein [Peptococcaceae bacterium]